MSQSVFSKAASEPVIYDGFAHGINALNKILVKDSPFMRKFADGRGYGKYGVGQPNLKPNIYAGAVHALSFAEQPPTRVLDHFARTPALNGELYMGAAGLLNFSYMAAMRPGAAILYDINPVQTWFWQYVLPILAKSDNGEHFMDTLVERTPEIHANVARLNKMTGSNNHLSSAQETGHSPAYYMDYTYILASELQNWRDLLSYRGSDQFNWIDDAEGFVHIREMARKDAIASITLDVLDVPGWKQLATHLDTNPAGAPSKAKIIYISNILTFLKETQDFTFRKDANANAAHVRNAVSQVMDGDNGIITHLADPRMRWPHDAFEPPANLQKMESPFSL